MSMLDPDLILEKARQYARSDDFLGEAWQPAFRALLASVEAEAGASTKRIERTIGEMLSLLVTRSRMAALLRARPEIRDVDLPAPVVITGLPRSGTTLLHNLMAVVPGHRAYRLWELRSPAFPIDAPADHASKELAHSAEVLEYLYDRAPAFKAIHPMAADAPDECNWLFRPTFTTMVYSWTNYAPSYERWLATADRAPAYAEWKLQLQMLRWRSPGGVPVLKDPGHLWSLPALFQTSPDARVVVLRRDLAETVPSLCSLCHTLQTMDARGGSPEKVGRYVIDMVARGEVALKKAQAAHPDRILLVDYGDLVADPSATVGRILDWTGRALDPIGARRVAEALAAGRTRSKTPHRYSLEQFGLSAGDLGVS